MFELLPPNKDILEIVKLYLQKRESLSQEEVKMFMGIFATFTIAQIVKKGKGEC